jgi:hypothetical protein
LQNKSSEFLTNVFLYSYSIPTQGKHLFFVFIYYIVMYDFLDKIAELLINHFYHLDDDENKFTNVCPGDLSSIVHGTLKGIVHAEFINTFYPEHVLICSNIICQNGDNLFFL